MPAMRRVSWAALAVAALTVLPAIAGAQQPTRRRQAPIEIRGVVPTPQVVTVRPREVPTYSRQVLVPRFFDHDFWPDIQTGYLMVPERQITGRAVADSLGAGTADTSTTRGTMAVPQRLTPPTPATTSPPGSTPPATTPDTTRRTPGTASAPPAR